MMAAGYQQGMVAQLLSGGRSSTEGKMASLFDAPADAKVLKPVVVKTEESQSTKKKKKAETSQESPPKKKKKLKASKQTGLTPQPATPSVGFDPPPGIVHEALAKAAPKCGKKRSRSIDHDEDDDDDDDKSAKKGIKEEKRPRRDRLQRANEKRTVFVGNVPLTTDRKKLARLFKQFGQIENVRFRCAPVGDPTTKKRVAVITKEFHEKRHNISAYVCFKEEEAAKQALTLNGHVLDGLHLRVDSAKPTLKKLDKRSVFVGNLPFDIEEESIRSHFEVCGDVENIRVVRDRKTNLGKGICYILFKTSDCVSLALKLNNSELEKRQIRVQRCKDPSKKDAKTKMLKPSYIDNKNRKPARDQKTSKQRTTDSDNKMKKTKKAWRPTNASDSQALQSHKTALKKKQRKSDKKKKSRSKVDELTRVLGPMHQPPMRSGGAKHKTKKGLKMGNKQKFKGKKKNAK